MRRVVHDGEGHVISPVDERWRRHDRDWSAGTGDDRRGGVSTTRFQELYSRASGHLVRVTASRVDALGNHSSPFGESSLFAHRDSTFVYHRHHHHHHHTRTYYIYTVSQKLSACKYYMSNIT